MFEFGKGKNPEGEQMQERATTTSGRDVSSAPAPDTRVQSSRRTAAVIGKSIQIEGDVKGEEDLIIEGNVQGTITLKSHSLTIGPEGNVVANLYAHTIRVEGRMEGDLYAAERVVITQSAQVIGNVISPRVNLEDGARFKGSIDMDPDALQPVFGRTRGEGAAPSATSKTTSISPSADTVRTATASTKTAG